MSSISEDDRKAKQEVKELIGDLNAVALDWSSSRDVEECRCSTSFDAFNKKVC